MHERDSRSGSAGRAAVNTALKGRPTSTVPWHPPVAARPAVPTPPPPATRRTAATPKLGFCPSQEPYELAYDDPESDAEMTRAWRQHEGRAKAELWAGENQEPTVTTSIKPCEIEEVREQLKREQERKVALARALHQSTVKTVPIVTEPEESEARPRRRALVTWLTPIAVLTFVCAVAYHRGYRPPRFDVARFAVSQVDLKPLWSTLEGARKVLRAEQDRLFAVGAESARGPSPQLAPAPPPPASAPVPIVEQLEVDAEEQVDVALPSSLGLSSDPEDAQPTLESSFASNDEGGEQVVDEQGTPPVDTSSQQVAPQPQAKRSAREPRGKGVLRVNSLPWAEIYVDGELLGHTPEMRLELPAGRHEVTLKNSEHNLLNTFVVHIRAGRVVTRIVNLRDEPKPGAP